MTARYRRVLSDSEYKPTPPGLRRTRKTALRASSFASWRPAALATTWIAAVTVGVIRLAVVDPIGLLIIAVLTVTAVTGLRQSR